jgi:hypothetical protein
MVTMIKNAYHSLIGIFQQDKTIFRDPFAMDLHSPPPQKPGRP